MRAFYSVLHWLGNFKTSTFLFGETDPKKSR